MPTRTTRKTITAFTLLMGMMLSGPVYGGIIAEDDAVPGKMDEGGTLADPALYVAGSSGAVILGNGSLVVTVGSLNSYNQLTIQNGSTFTSWFSYIGFETTSGFNSVTVTGEGSNFHSDSYVDIGTKGSNNSVIVENRASITSIGARIGDRESASNNFAIIRGTGSTWTTTWGGFVIGNLGQFNSLTVEDGASVTTTSYFSIGSGDSGYSER